MPIIARFYGIIMKMYFLQSEHNPPHVHAIYNEYNGVIDIETLEMIEGDLPVKAQKLVQEWVKLYQKDLQEMWHTQNFKKLPPLE